ncbi:hypothetical protein CMEL01_07085 [Colletotrichum melonis]|uniref:Uncharacterized protein n=1 Tax=Colletotrichum melonis TaxID=1209925 RepID=A0AAI9U166_9PEZI|nr:hypothetical protein CMEL01_07085 [Colletotrichum melonis]
MDMTHALRPPSGLLHPLSLLSFVPLFFGSLYHAGGQNLTRSTIDTFFFSFVLLLIACSSCLLDPSHPRALLEFCLDTGITIRSIIRRSRGNGNRWRQFQRKGFAPLPVCSPVSFSCLWGMTRMTPANPAVCSSFLRKNDSAVVFYFVALSHRKGFFWRCIFGQGNVHLVTTKFSLKRHKASFKSNTSTLRALIVLSFITKIRLYQAYGGCPWYTGTSCLSVQR